jgi:hypothetical protein
MGLLMPSCPGAVGLLVLLRGSASTGWPAFQSSTIARCGVPNATQLQKQAPVCLNAKAIVAHTRSTGLDDLVEEARRWG